MKNMKKLLNISLGQVPMGTIVAFALNDSSVPEGWLLCDGRDIPSKYQSLKTALGSETTPNLCGRTLIGTGKPNKEPQSDKRDPNFDDKFSWPLAYTGGEYAHKLTIDEMPSHFHFINDGNFGLHKKSFKGENGHDLPYKTSADPDNVIGHTDLNGRDKLHNMMQPYYAVNYIIYAGK